MPGFIFHKFTGLSLSFIGGFTSFTTFQGNILASSTVNAIAIVICNE